MEVKSIAILFVMAISIVSSEGKILISKSCVKLRANPFENTYFVAQTCRTTSDSPGPSQNKPCVFPFKFQDKIRYGCITDADPDGRYWCSTRTDDDLNHITGQGFWGYCMSQNCPKSRVTQQSTQSFQSTKFAAEAQDECEFLQSTIHLPSLTEIFIYLVQVP